jgi:hypothetical protein
MRLAPQFIGVLGTSPWTFADNSFVLKNRGSF